LVRRRIVGHKRITEQAPMPRSGQVRVDGSVTGIVVALSVDILVAAVPEVSHVPLQRRSKTL
jgi:hypothetical protein